MPGRLLRLPLRLIPARAVLPILHGRLRGQWWIAGAGNHGCWLGGYERRMRRAFEQRVAPGSVVFDLGAHAGFYTLLASVLVGPRGKVFAFEPLPDNLLFLRRHLELNGVDNVTVLQRAVSDGSGTAPFRRAASRSMGRIEEHGSLRVQTVSLDELVAGGEVPPPDFIKIDIEGAEAVALAGARATLQRSHPTIFLATHGAERQRACRRLLEGIGYGIEPIDATDVERSSELVATFRPQNA